MRADSELTSAGNARRYTKNPHELPFVGVLFVFLLIEIRFLQDRIFCLGVKYKLANWQAVSLFIHSFKLRPRCAPLVGESPIPWNSSFDEATLRHLLFFIKKCSCDFLCELKFFHCWSYFPVFAIPFFLLFQHFCIFFCKLFASYTLFVLEWFQNHKNLWFL